jgi:hypothetical protein
MRTFIILIVTGLVTVNLAGCFTPDAAQDVDAATAPRATTEGPHAVLAFIDGGINPYHLDFRDDSPRAFQHPSTYLPDYPEDAVALDITFDHGTVEDAIEADCAVWERVEPGELYWFPGTRVVGAYVVPGTWEELPYQDEDHRPITCADPSRATWGNVFSESMHGTMVASRGAGNAYGACPECLIVAVHGLGPDAVTWTAEQPWIDVASHSWGPQFPAFQPDGMPWPRIAASPALVEAVEAAAQAQPHFWATGNGAAFRFGVLGHPTQLLPQHTPSVIRVGGHDSGYVTVWPGSSPHVISDACWSWAAEHDTMDEWTPRTGSGTSGATPFVAGLAGNIILEARALLGDPRTGVTDGVLASGDAGAITTGPLADGAFTMDELKRVLFTTADPRPERIEEDGDVCDPLEDPVMALVPALPVKWEDVPEGAHGIPFVGYGAVTPYTVADAFAVLHGDAEWPARPEEDAFFEADDAFRSVAFDAFTAPGGVRVVQHGD